MRAYIFLAAVLAAGCGSRPHALSFKGSTEGFQAAREAAAQWSTTCGVDLQVQRDVEGVPLLEVPSIEENPSRRGVTTLDAAGEPALVRFVLYEHATATLAHEFGHVLGLGHAPDGLMAEEGGPDVPRVTEKECAALSAVADQ